MLKLRIKSLSDNNPDSGGDKSKSTTKVDLPPELQKFYKQQTEMSASMMPQYQALLQRAMRGETGAVAPYAQPLAPGYQDVLSQAYTPMAGSYQATEGAYTPMAQSYWDLANTYTPVAGSYAPTAGTYTPVSGNFQSVASTFQPGKEAYTAPYAGQIQNAQQQIRRVTPGGGGQQAAMAQATMQGAMQMGAARAQQGQRDRDARNALAQEDARTRMGLGVEDTRNLGTLRLEDVRAGNTLSQQDLANWARLREADATNRNALSQQDLQQLAARRLEDVRGGNTLTQKDLEQFAALRKGDADARNQLAAMDLTKQNEMMQRLLQLYSGIFGGFSPAQQAGTSQTSSTGGRVGVPFADIGV